MRAITAKIAAGEHPEALRLFHAGMALRQQ
jgi:hypothetical protein